MANVSFLTSPLLDTPHGFLRRHGGTSTGIFKSLNCGLPKTPSLCKLESRENVFENRKRAVMALGGDPQRLCLSKQIHGNTCLTVTDIFSGDAQAADALVTKTTGLVIGVRTADCVPVLFHDPVAKVVGVAHAGWKGALAGIVDTTVNHMKAIGSDPRDIRAVLGPSIDQDSYEVDEIFFQEFINKSFSYKVFFKAGQHHGKHFFNLPAFVVNKLMHAGIESIENTDVSTYRNADDFFSCRRAFHKDEPGFGNQLSLIFMKTST